MCSWISFWLVKTKAGGEIVARVGLGITCCLAVVTIGFIGETKPKVPYATALDVFIIMCFAFVFLALVEYAFIHFVEFYVRRVKFKDQDRAIHLQEMTKSLIIPVMPNFDIEAKLPGSQPSEIEKKFECKRTLSRFISRSNIDKEGHEETNEIRSEPNILQSDSLSIETDIHFVESTEVKTENDIEWVTVYSSWESLNHDQAFDEYEDNESPWTIIKQAVIYFIDFINRTRLGDYLQKMELYYDTTAAVDRFDRYCRIVFPAELIILNVVYWILYLRGKYRVF